MHWVCACSSPTIIFRVKHYRMRLQSSTPINPVAFSYGYDRLRFVKPVFIGDTIRSRVEIIAIEPMEKRPGFGRVTERLTVTNQKDETVLVADHIYMVERQP